MTHDEGRGVLFLMIFMFWCGFSMGSCITMAAYQYAKADGGVSQ